MELRLWFQRRPTVELVQVEFHRAGLPVLRSFRGKAAVISTDAGLFQWTSAVKAFAQLAVGFVAARGGDAHDRSASSFTIEGEAGSAAATLDYAISKPTAWILDLFGRESNGKAFARHLFKRENSERKLPGPVRITLASAFSEPGAVRIFFDGRELLTPDQADRLARELQPSPQPPSKGAPKTAALTTRSKAYAPTPLFEAAWFRAQSVKEATRSLEDLSVLEPTSIQLAAARLTRIRRAPVSAIQKLSRALIEALPAPAQRYRARSGPVLRGRFVVALPPTAVGALTILTLMQSRGDAVEIRNQFPSSSAILEEPGAENFDGLVLSWGAAVKALSSTRLRAFTAVLPLPRTHFHLVLAPTRRDPARIKKVMLAEDPYGYPMQFLRDLKAQRHLSPAVKSVDATFSEVMNYLSIKGDAAILGYPFSQLVAKRCNGRFVEFRNAKVQIGDNLLFVRDPARASQIREAILSNWYTLLEDPATLDSVTQTIFSQLDFVNYLYRLAALYNLGERELDVREDRGRIEETE